MRTYGGGRCRDPRITDLGTSWRRVVNFTLLPLYHRYTLDRGAESAWEPVLTSGGEKSCSYRVWNSQPLGHPGSSQSLYRLRYTRCTLRAHRSANATHYENHTHTRPWTLTDVHVAYRVGNSVVAVRYLRSKGAHNYKPRDSLPMKTKLGECTPW
jgi:hypothetical protein